jgi:hypothetical protein
MLVCTPRSTRFLVTVIALLGLLASSADAETAQGKRAWSRFAADNGTGWRAEWTAAGDQATRLRGEAAPVAGHPETVAATFLSANADVLGIRADLADLRVASTRESLVGHHVTYQQSYGGLPVFNGFVDVHVKRGGSVFLVHNETATAAALGTLPRKARLTAADAAWTAQSAHFNTQLYDKRGNPIPPASTEIQDGPELGVQRTERGLRLAYQVTVGAVRYVVDGGSGEIMEALPLMQSVNGSGRVFDPNPVNTLDDGSLTDQSNTNYAALSGAYVNKPLLGLTSTGTGANLRYLLRGPHVRMVDLRASAVASCMTGQNELRLPPPRSTTTTFNFNRNQSGFEHTMAYFHIDRSQRYIKGLGFTNLWNDDIRVDAHAFPQDNSFYCGSPAGAGYLAFGDGGVDDAEDADVVLHEYGHALQDAAAPGRYLSSGQAGAMGEGFGDYWSYTQRQGGTYGPCFAEWDGEGTCLRRLDRNKKYPDGYVGQVHKDGEIWSRGLRDLNRKLTKNVANKIILQSHFLIATNPTFQKGLRALLDADEELNDGANKDDICATFADRGIRAADCGYWITMRWNNLGADVDLHFTNPAGNMCYYLNLNPDWGVVGDATDNPQLYHDCITDCTFEQITVETLTTPGTYVVSAYYYSDRGRGASTVTMEVYRGAQRLFRGTQTLAGTGANWNAYNIVISAGAKPEIVEVNQVTHDPDLASRLPKKQP